MIRRLINDLFDLVAVASEWLAFRRHRRQAPRYTERPNDDHPAMTIDVRTTPEAEARNRADFYKYGGG